MNRTAQVVLFDKINHVTTGSAALKECAPSEVICETLYSTISPGTELRMLAGHYGTQDKFPYIPGYSSVGKIIALGSEVTGWRVGDLVNMRNTAPFADTTTLYGGHSSHKVVATVGTDRIVRLPDNVDPLDYVLTDVAAISLRGVEAAAPKSGETAVVIGQGLIGALSAAWLAIHGCRVIVVDLEASRLERALRNGAAYAVSPKESDAAARILTLCNGGADIVVEASGSTPGVELACKLLRKKPQNYAKEYTVEPILHYGGDWPRLVFQANYLEPMPWKPDSCLPGEAVIFITPRDRGVEERQRVIEHVRAGRLKTRDFVESVVPWQKAPEAYEGLKTRKIFSAVIYWKGAR
jgi:2-desacetyl-2-hydroxyethyl bacteriochlorophyllide A dehydrogenase